MNVVCSIIFFAYGLICSILMFRFFKDFWSRVLAVVGFLIGFILAIYIFKN